MKRYWGIQIHVDQSKPDRYRVRVPKPMARLFYKWVGRIQRQHGSPIEIEHVAVAFMMATGLRGTVPRGRVSKAAMYRAVVQHIPAAIELVKKNRELMAGPHGASGPAPGDRPGSGAAGPGAEPVPAAPDTAQCPLRPEPHPLAVRRQGDGLLFSLGRELWTDLQWQPGTRLTLVKLQGQFALREAEPSEPGAPLRLVGDTAEVYFSEALVEEIKTRLWGST